MMRKLQAICLLCSFVGASCFPSSVKRYSTSVLRRDSTEVGGRASDDESAEARNTWVNARQFCEAQGSFLFAPDSDDDFAKVNISDFSFWTGWQFNDGRFFDQKGTAFNGSDDMWLEEAIDGNCSAGIPGIKKLIKRPCNATTYDVGAFYCVEKGYELVKGETTWNEAKEHCEDRGGSLLNMLSIDEVDREPMLANLDVKNTTFIWNGLRKSEDDGAWVDMQSRTKNEEELNFVNSSKGNCSAWVVKQARLLRRPCDKHSFDAQEFICVESNDNVMFKYPDGIPPETTVTEAITTTTTSATTPATTSATTPATTSATTPATTSATPTPEEKCKETASVINSQHSESGFDPLVIGGECMVSASTSYDGEETCATLGSTMVNTTEFIRYFDQWVGVAEKQLEMNVYAYSFYWGRGKDVYKTIQELNLQQSDYSDYWMSFEKLGSGEYDDEWLMLWFDEARTHAPTQRIIYPLWNNGVLDIKREYYVVCKK